MSHNLGSTPAERFVGYALHTGALKLSLKGFKLVSGRMSPYFFNSGFFNTGDKLARIAGAYGEVIRRYFQSEAGNRFDLLYGPPYKGTILAPAIAMNLDLYGPVQGIETPFCTSRKEVKDHGEEGLLIGTPITLRKRVLIIDDVITDGGTKRTAVDFIRQFDGLLAGLVIAFDRQERGSGNLSAVQQFELDYNVPAHAAASLADLISFLEKAPDTGGGEMLEKVLAYKEQYGAT